MISGYFPTTSSGMNRDIGKQAFPSVLAMQSWTVLSCIASTDCLSRALDFKLAAPPSMTSWNSPPFLTPPVNSIRCEEFSVSTACIWCFDHWVCMFVCACVCACMNVALLMLSNNGLWNTYIDWDGWLSWSFPLIHSFFFYRLVFTSHE